MDWSLISVLVALGVALIIWVRRRYLFRPELTLELKKVGGHSLKLGASIRQGEPDEIAGTSDQPVHIYNSENVLLVWETRWEMHLFIRNNSDYTAYYPRILFDSQKPWFTRIETLNQQKPIGSKQEILLKAEYAKLDEANGRNRPNANGLPPALEDLKICVEYKNGSKRTFYSVYSNRTKVTEFKRKLTGPFIWKIE